jgi:hypothetical protein
LGTPELDEFMDAHRSKIQGAAQLFAKLLWGGVGCGVRIPGKIGKEAVPILGFIVFSSKSFLKFAWGPIFLNSSFY